MSRMTPEELFAEIDWFLQCGVSPDLTAQVLGKNVVTLARYCYRYGRPDLANVYNTRALWKRGPQVGTVNRSAKLNYETAQQIREFVAAGNTQDAAAIKFGVGRSTVSRVIRGVVWTDAA